MPNDATEHATSAPAAASKTEEQIKSEALAAADDAIWNHTPLPASEGPPGLPPLRRLTLRVIRAVIILNLLGLISSALAALYAVWITPGAADICSMATWRLGTLGWFCHIEAWFLLATSMLAFAVADADQYASWLHEIQAHYLPGKSGRFVSLFALGMAYVFVSHSNAAAQAGEAAERAVAGDPDAMAPAGGSSATAARGLSRSDSKTLSRCSLALSAWRGALVSANYTTELFLRKLERQEAEEQKRREEQVQEKREQVNAARSETKLAEARKNESPVGVLPQLVAAVGRTDDVNHARELATLAAQAAGNEVGRAERIAADARSALDKISAVEGSQLAVQKGLATMQTDEETLKVARESVIVTSAGIAKAEDAEAIRSAAAELTRAVSSATSAAERLVGKAHSVVSNVEQPNENQK